MALDAAFWDEVQRSSMGRIGSTVMLAETPPEEVLRLHGVDDLPKWVMDIGVGNGAMTSHLKSQGCHVVAVDISPSALSRCDAADLRFLVDDLPKSPEVDLAICHLVLQHCNVEQVKQIVSGVPLSNSGFLSAQYASSDGPIPVKWDEYLVRGELIFRSPAEYEAMFRECGLEVLAVSEIARHESVIWHTARLR